MIDIVHSAGKFVFFHSDGNIEAILGDLIEVGIDAINSQLFIMNIEELGKKYKGKLSNVHICEFAFLAVNKITTSISPMPFDTNFFLPE